MNTIELLNIRLQNQLLSDHHLKEPQEVVSCLGAMQAQTLDLAKWGIGARLETKTVKDVEEALNTGKIIRTHILRPTWHFVAAEDIYWMSILSNPRLKSVYLSYCKMLEVDESVIIRTFPLLEKIMVGSKHLTKEEIGEALSTEKTVLDPNLLKLVIFRAEIEGILCNGQLRGSKQTYTLLEEWIPNKQLFSKEEALRLLAYKYFTSHGPATEHDFTWWSGLSLTECRQAIEMIKDDFVSEIINGRSFWMKNDIEVPDSSRMSALLLPPFDEFVVSYKDRSEIIAEAHYGKVMTKNGLFSPTVMYKGEIVGSWRKAKRKGMIHIELSFFEKMPKKIQDLFKPEIKRLERFYS